MLILTKLGWAALPWECPPVTVPADAVVYRDDTSAAEALAVVETELLAWWDAGCAWTSTEAGTTVSTCVTDAGAALTEETASWTLASPREGTGQRVSREVALPDGRRISFSRASSAWSSGSQSSGAETVEAASWVGAVPGVPADGAITRTTTGYWTTLDTTLATSVETPACAWSTSETTGEGVWREVSAGGHEVEVVLEWLDCGTRDFATLDGVLFGAVHRDTWTLAEADRDGWADDCDDTDPSVHPCAEDVAGDGIDQDCDGSDRDGVDADGDGVTADGDGAAADCDEADPSAYPGAPEVPYDGVDQDCDGADLTDADGDGWDGVDAGGADCLDTDPTRNPDASDHLCDGEDRDCDGLDCPSEAEPPPVPGGGEERGGCGSGAAWVVFLPMIWRRRC